MLDKPAGPTSHDVVAIIRRAFGTRRVGHTGTLDPFATGLLLVLVGQATRLARYLVGLPKEYHGVLRLGSTTTTDDATGEVTGASDDWRALDDARLRAAMAALLGEREQVPPAYSAKRVRGERAHRLARRGAALTLAPTRVEVQRFDLTDRSGADARFVAAVGSGTYVRSLARELGEILGCGAHLVELRRTAVGPFRVDGATSLEDVRQGRAVLAAPAAALPHLAAAAVEAAAVERLIRGQPIDASHAAAGPLALLCDGRLVAVVQPRAGQWHPEVVLAG
ncbi:MAG: tRNA pseudouridine(55) synthase TruB [Gemmatimonadetes bacterium]|nr:tRNA pseudouridine(55) synthase TruB [Gemmatimonadota bacterium]